MRRIRLAPEIKHIEGYSVVQMSNNLSIVVADCSL